MPRIDVSSLGLGSVLGSGGQGKVTAVNGLLSGGYAAVLKVYTADAVRALDSGALENIVGFPRQLSDADRGWLLENTAWPSMVAEDGGVVCGFVMRMVPQAYYFSFRTQSLGARQELANVAFLLNSDAYVAGSGLSVSDRDRIALLRSLAAALSRLHALDVVAGDLSPKNLLFRLAPVPGCFLIDCDAMRVRGQSVLPQVQTPDWEIPAGEPVATAAADAYKFGLLAIRLFARDQSSGDWAALAALSPDLGRLADLSLHDDPARRPGPGAWIPALDAAAAIVSAAPAAGPPTMTAQRLSVPVDTVGLAPAAPVPAAPAPRGPVPAGPAARPRRRGLAVIGAALTLAVIVVVIVVGYLVTRPAAPAVNTGTATGSTQDGTQGSGGTTGSGGQDTTETGEVGQVDSLLGASASSRQSLTTAVRDVGNCTDTGDAISVLSGVVGQRSSEYSQAQGLATGALAGGAQLKADLLSALRSSLRADRDFLQWAQDNQACTTTVPPDGSYNAGVTASRQAVRAKNAFLRIWNPIAEGQGLQTRTNGGI